MKMLKELIRIFGPQTDEDLVADHERLRLLWLETGDERIHDAMDTIDQKMVKRSNKRYQKEHPDTETRHREHGWYLPNDNDD